VFSILKPLRLKFISKFCGSSTSELNLAAPMPVTRRNEVAFRGPS
jgi:hypothetical protein